MTGMDPVIAQPYNDQGSCDKYCLDYCPEAPNNSFNRLSSFVAAAKASMQLSAVLPMGGSAIASTSQPVPCWNSNSNTNDITSITNWTSIENWGFLEVVQL
jgi:hypothetical protein